MMRRQLLRASVVFLLIGIVSVGAGQILAKKPSPPTGCPSPAPGWACPLYYEPVVCGPNDCWYSNMCFAGCTPIYEMT